MKSRPAQIDLTRNPLFNMEITLTPKGTIIWPERISANGGPHGPTDWRGILFCLAINALPEGHTEDDRPACFFWHSFAEFFLTSLCRINEDASSPHLVDVLPTPSDTRLDLFLEKAPLMRGGEYLSRESLLQLWGHLAAWCQEKVRECGGLTQFMEAWAPRWRRVGLVSFHLAENKADPDNPFAFLATYTVGLNSKGQPVHQILGEALKRYASEDDRPALVHLLSPVREAANRLDWVSGMVKLLAVYGPHPLSSEQAYRFLADVPVLEQCGLKVSIPDWWQKRPQAKVQVTVGDSGQTMLGAGALLDWNASLALGDQTMTEAELRSLLAAREGLVSFKGQWIEVNHEQLRQALEHWKNVRKEVDAGEISFSRAMRLLAGLPGAFGSDAEDVDSGVVWNPQVVAGQALREMLHKMRQPEACGVPASLRATLRPYQKEGLSWLVFLSRLGLGACLADDMGLGKTVQVLALLLWHKEQDGAKLPSLLVVPASLLANWKNEAMRFAPDLRLAIFHASENSKAQLAQWQDDVDALREADLVVTSYGMLAKTGPLFTQKDWHLIIADEAQNIKNASTQQARAIKKLKGSCRIALTGTPIENRLADLWSLFDCINPGLLGSAKAFKTAVKRLERRTEDQYGPLRRLVAPYILRRLKTDRHIISDLPDKVESITHCHLTPAQAKLYNKIVENLRQRLQTFASSAGANSERRGLVLQSLMALKQVCNHPSQHTGAPDWLAAKSGKFARISELCGEMAERQERVLVFTQFREIIEPLSGHLASVFGKPGIVLHGGTSVKQRQILVDSFQRDDGPPFFILSLKAGGTGLNLTAAGHVIHFDRWWNPAAEDQATDRAFRIGQQKNVLVHKCVTLGTLEERIDALLLQKRALAGDILGKGDEVDITSLDDAALLQLVSLDVDRAVL